MTIIEATTRISLRNILFATDFSQYSTAALPYAVSLAAKHGAKVLAAHIAPAPVPAPSGSWDVTVERSEREAREKLEKIAPILQFPTSADFRISFHPRRRFGPARSRSMQQLYEKK